MESTPGRPRPPGMGRRAFVKRGLAGAALLAAAGAGTAVATRRARREVPGRYAVLSPADAAVVEAAAERIVPAGAGLPAPAALRIAERVDGIVALAHPAAQKEVRDVLSLLDSGVAGLLLDGHGGRFTELAPDARDARLRSWARSRLAVRRSGWRALRKLVVVAYYGSEETWAAIGYPPPPGAEPRSTPAVPAGGGT